MQWLKGKLIVRYEITAGGSRIEHWEISEIAYCDARVEISNPAGLTSAILPSKFGTKAIAEIH